MKSISRMRVNSNRIQIQILVHKVNKNKMLKTNNSKVSTKLKIKVSSKNSNSRNKMIKSQQIKMRVIKTIKYSIKSSNSLTSLSTNTKSIKMKWSSYCKYPNSCNRSMLTTKLKSKRLLKMEKMQILRQNKLWWRYKKNYFIISNRFKIWPTLSNNMNIKSFRFNSNCNRLSKKTFHLTWMRISNNNSRFKISNRLRMQESLEENFNNSNN